MFITQLRADSGMDRSPFGDFFFQPIGLMSRSGVRVTPATAMGIPTFYAGVNLLAKSFASMPFGLFRPKVGGGRARVTKHWLNRLFTRYPNRFQTPFEWRMMLMGHLAMRGNAFCQIASNGGGEITELLPLHPDRMTIDLLDGGNYRYKYVDQNGNDIYYARGEIWHLRWLSDDGYMGISPIQAAREALAEGISIQAYSARFFANDARPGGGWIEYPGGFATKESKKVFRESWQEMQGGQNRGKVAVLEKGMKYHELGLNNKESQFIEARAEKKKEIAALLGIPAHKLGIMEDATFSNIEQQAIEFWTDCMWPWAECWESSIEYNLLGPEESTGLEPEFDMTRMMRGDSATRSEYITKLVNCGVLTRNEGREIEGYDPIDGLDEPLRPLNMIEESQAPDEIAEGDAGADDRRSKKAPPADDEEDDGASSRRDGHRARKAAAKAALLEGAAARVDSMLLVGAERLARRISKEGKAPDAELVAATMGVPVARAGAWVDSCDAALAEDKLIASLMALGKSV